MITYFVENSDGRVEFRLPRKRSQWTAVGASYCLVA
jgi:hypothetical protein